MKVLLCKTIMSAYDTLIGELDDVDVCGVILDTPTAHMAVLKQIAAVDDAPRATTAPINIVQPTANLFDPPTRYKYVADVSCVENTILSNCYVTTTTLSGVLENFTIDVTDIHKFKTNSRVVMIKSNFGCIVDPSYSPKPKPKRKARAKETKAKKERKKQGDGSCFNSQITFLVRTDLIDRKNPSETIVYKFKIFQKCKMQLPGALPEHIVDVVAAIDDIIDVINERNKSVDPNAPPVQLLSLTPQLKNYKFYVKMTAGHIVDLHALKQVLFDAQHKNTAVQPCACGERSCARCYLTEFRSLGIAEWCGATPPRSHPTIINVIYTLEDTKLGIDFATPIPGKPKKTARVNVYPGSVLENYAEDVPDGDYGARINILGGLEESATEEIYDFLRWIFEAYGHYLIVSVGAATPIAPLKPNVLAVQQKTVAALTEEIFEVEL
jgi:hypothetical protein